MAAFFRKNIFFSLKKQGKELVKDRIRFPSALSPGCIFLRFFPHGPLHDFGKSAIHKRVEWRPKWKRLSTGVPDLKSSLFHCTKLE